MRQPKAKHNPDGSRDMEAGSLYQQAESRLSGDLQTPTPARSADTLLHELQVHQIELEMQGKELVQTQVDLEEARERYADFYDFAPSGYVTLGSDALIADINFAGAQLFGMDRSKICSKCFTSFVVPEDQELWHRHFLATLQHDRKLACDLRILSKDGLTLFVHLDSIRLKKPNKEVVVRIVLTDITELKNTESALRESEAQRRILEKQEVVRASLDGFWTVDTTSGRIIDVNERYCSMMGYSREELLHMKVCEIEAIETAEEVAAHFKKITHSQYDRFETLQRHKQGHLVDIEVSAICSNLTQGVNFAFLRDISERKRKEEALRRSQRQLKTFILQAPICIAMFDRDLNYLAVSGRWSSEFGHGYQSLVGLNHYKLCPNQTDVWNTIHQQVLAGASLENEDDLWTCGDGKNYRLRWAALPWIDENDQIGGIIIYVEDITDQKNLEKELIQRRAEMEMLQRLQVAVQTASAIAHELNQPLLAIASYSEAALLLMDEAIPNLEKIRQTIKKSECQALRAGISIREIMDSLNRGDYPVEDFDLNDEIIKVIQIANSEHDLKFRAVLTLADGLPPVRVNRTHFQKVLLNLLHNSIEAMSEAGVPLPAITVTVTSRKDEHAAHVSVQDNGPGISGEVLQRLFEPFFTTKAAGIGMGLAISRSLIEEAGGQLWVDPQTNAGATFHMTLPFAT